MSQKETPENWEILTSVECFSASPFVSVWKEKIVTGGGHVVDDYYRVKLPAFALCVPCTTDGRIVTIWQYKHGPRQHNLTFPAGLIEPAEDPETACARELLEETGFTGSALVHLGSYVDSGNQEGSTGNYYVATHCRYVREPSPGDLEAMEVRLMTVGEVDSALANGEFAIVHHVAAWLLAKAKLGL